jgi:hypothetical protein
MLNPSASIGGTLTKVYDGTTTATGATLSGTVTGIAGDSLGLNFTGVSLAYNGSHVVGTNVIVATGLPTLTINSSTALSAPTDYSYTAPTIANATASITPYLLTPTASIGGTLTKVYDGTTAATGATLSGTVTGIAGDSLSLNFTGVSLDYNGTHVVGTNAIVATGAPTLTINSPTALSVASDYTYIAPSITNATASITPAALSIVANSINKTYDGNAYSGGNGVIYAGFVNGEGVGVLGGTLAYSGTSQGAINSGSYVITPGGLTSSDYNIGFVNGVLTVNTPATIATIQQILSTNNTPSVAVTSNTSSSNVSAGPVNTTNSDSTNSTTTNGTSTNSVATNTDSTNTPSTVSIATNSTATNSDTTSTNSTTSTVTNSSPANSDSTNAASTTSVATNSDTTNATSTNNTTANSDTKNTDKKNTSSTNSTTTNNKDKPSAKLKKC